MHLTFIIQRSQNALLELKQKNVSRKVFGDL